MKATIFFLFFLSVTLSAQNTRFTKLFYAENSGLVNPLIELPNKDLVAVITDFKLTPTQKIYAKIITLKADGTIKDSVVFNQLNKNLQIHQLVPTDYGYCILGEMEENNQLYFWSAKLDKQFGIVSQHFEQLRSDVFDATISNFAFTKDSSIIAILRLSHNTGFSFAGAKISNSGVLNSYVNLQNMGTLPNSVVVRNDSLGYLLLGLDIIATDTSFNVLHRKNLAVQEYGTRIAYVSLEPTYIKKNDTTFFCAGRWTEYNGRRTNDLMFLVVGLKGENKFHKSIGAIRDTNYAQAVNKSADTTKDGRFIYWGGTYNFDFLKPLYSPFNSKFVLTKMDSAYQNVWQKSYGGDAYYFMRGVLATSDGGCAMYGLRYDFNIVPKTDGIIIKVDGNGVVISTTTIPMNQSSIIAYPNPSNGLLNFKKGDPSVSGAFEVNIFDISGKLVFQKRETDLSETFDLSHFAEGNYIYQIKQQEQIISVGKWVKIK
jgi:Secretion system C-terminal sorting domain